MGRVKPFIFIVGSFFLVLSYQQCAPVNFDPANPQGTEGGLDFVEPPPVVVLPQPAIPDPDVPPPVEPRIPEPPRPPVLKIQRSVQDIVVKTREQNVVDTSSMQTSLMIDDSLSMQDSINKVGESLEVLLQKSSDLGVKSMVRFSKLYTRPTLIKAPKAGEVYTEVLMDRRHGEVIGDGKSVLDVKSTLEQNEKLIKDYLKYSSSADSTSATNEFGRHTLATRLLYNEGALDNKMKQLILLVSDEEYNNSIADDLVVEQGFNWTSGSEVRLAAGRIEYKKLVVDDKTSAMKPAFVNVPKVICDDFINKRKTLNDLKNLLLQTKLVSGSPGVTWLAPTDCRVYNANGAEWEKGIVHEIKLADLDCSAASSALVTEANKKRRYFKDLQRDNIVSCKSEAVKGGAIASTKKTWKDIYRLHGVANINEFIAKRLKDRFGDRFHLALVFNTPARESAYFGTLQRCKDAKVDGTQYLSLAETIAKDMGPNRVSVHRICDNDYSGIMEKIAMGIEEIPEDEYPVDSTLWEQIEKSKAAVKLLSNDELTLLEKKTDLSVEDQEKLGKPLEKGKHYDLPKGKIIFKSGVLQSDHTVKIFFNQLVQDQEGGE